MYYDLSTDDNGQVDKEVLIAPNIPDVLWDDENALWVTRIHDTCN
ncbi:hypothetical protein TCAL_01093, partial [Tigriopus californicus]|eukprot:TCALIF_01093-PA protein Name:"Protein of unknown function" AED:0.15 eAED:0.15 QI:203/1/0.5/1/1/1/2/0/44